MQRAHSDWSTHWGRFTRWLNWVALSLPLGGLFAFGLLPRLAAAPAPTSWECRWTDRPVVIDGRADETAWRGAQLIDGFQQFWLGAGPSTSLRGGAPRTRTTTRARLLWDREYLYFFAELQDFDLVAGVREHDGMTWHDDVFELFFKPGDEWPGYYEFQVNALGTQLDMFLPRRGDGGYERHKSIGDFHMESRVVLNGTLNERSDRDRGWTVEGRIPWTDLMRTGGRPRRGEQWKFALCRYDYDQSLQSPELSSTAPLTRPDFHRWEDYGRLVFAGPNDLTANRYGVERRIPLTGSTVVGSPDPPLPYRLRRVYPNLQLSSVSAVAHEPGSNRILALVHNWKGSQTGLVRFMDDPNVTEVETVLALDAFAYEFTFHPKFAENGFIYFGGKRPMQGPRESRNMQVLRYTMQRQPPFAIDPKSEQLIIQWPSDGHDGGAMVFGLDGMLYLTTGDGTSDSDTNIAGQNMTLLTAKLLRIDVERPDPGRAYSVPRDNPFVGMPDVRPETWAHGFRNPWKMTIDRKTGQIWVGNNGQDLWETAYLIERGANYGWSVYEGSHPFYLNRKLGSGRLTKPTVEHHHSEARSLTGGLVYYGTRFPDLQGAYLYGDYSTGRIWGIRHDGQKVLWHRELADGQLQITAFGTDSRGELLIADYGGQGGLYTLDPSPTDAPTPSFPRTLSQSGLFRSVRGHVPHPALIPYSVNSQLWSDGAHKERFIALPGGDDSQITVTESRGWEFPDRTVLVKSFALELEEGNPRSRRWIETRFLTRQEGEWVGYSYEWNQAQNEATLVDKQGVQREFRVKTRPTRAKPEGWRTQVWQYPSRADCMVCHTRAANFVLGLNTLQMNREHSYGRVRDNQLRMLEHLGVLRIDWNNEARKAIRAAARQRGMNERDASSYVARHTANSGQRPPAVSTLLAQPPNQLPRLVDPEDVSADLNHRARSYLHSNCSNCHVGAGGGNSQITLESTTPVAEMQLFEVRPLHDAFGISDARLVAAGSPERSVLLHRVAMRDRGHMPPLATSQVDQRAVELLREWIKRLPQ